MASCSAAQRCRGQRECHIGLTQLPAAKESRERANEKESRLSQTDGRSEQQINYRYRWKNERKASEWQK